ncbi:MAG: ATP-dependent Clp protease ATP-binding subunit [Oligoflexales bacterium]
MHKFDSTVTGALDIAQTEAISRKNTELFPEHLMLGFLAHPKSKTSKLLKEYEPAVLSLIDKLPYSHSSVTPDTLRPSSKLSQWLTLASSTAAKGGRDELTEADFMQNVHGILPNLDLPRSMLSDYSSQDDVEEKPDFLIDLNDLARKGKLDPVIGRTKEIRSVMEILGRRGKNNPVLVGPAGVGKTAIVEGLADQIVKGKVPDVLRNKIVYSLEMGSLMAGTKYRGEFEERMQRLLKFIRHSEGESILFIDEIHQLVGAGRTEGAMDAANLLKPALARGELHCIGATTPEEFQKYILGDPALERRFRSVPINEPSKEDALEILMGIRDKLEMHHGIKISDDALFYAVHLSDQYITDKNLPDKAIDLVDEGASALKLSAEAMPAPLAELEAEIRNKTILAQVEKDNEKIKHEINSLKKRFDKEKASWESHVAALRQVSMLKTQLEKLKFDLETAERDSRYEEASRLKYSLIPEIEKKLEEHQHDWVLNRTHIAGVIARQTGIPVEKILKDKQENILELEGYLNSRIFGQESALHEISETLMTSYAGLSDPSRPMGSFLLTGPTGVGKTETAKALAQFLFDTEKNMVRLDLSEYSEKHSVAKLIGAPAGYVGYDEGGILTEAVRRKPYSLILFDEVEKAHPDFSDILLQILDDGRLTDNKGRVINFKNTIVLLTTNSKNIHQDFKPEVLGRLDGVLHYKPIDKSIMAKLVERQLEETNERLKAKKIHITLTDAALRSLCEQGYDPNFGARPLRSVFNKLINRKVSHEILSGKLSQGEHTISVKNGEFTLLSDTQ